MTRETLGWLIYGGSEIRGEAITREIRTFESEFRNSRKVDESCKALAEIDLRSCWTAAGASRAGPCGRELLIF